ncbi:unnamed protein product [Brassica rapa subsp. narinosa]
MVRFEPFKPVKESDLRLGFRFTVSLFLLSSAASRPLPKSSPLSQPTISVTTLCLPSISLSSRLDNNTNSLECNIVDLVVFYFLLMLVMYQYHNYFFTNVGESLIVCVSETSKSLLIIFIEALGMLYALSIVLQVAIEFGLCETLNTMAIKSDVVPKDGKFDFKFSDLEAMFPEGTFDHNVEMAYKEFPQWGESVEAFKERYVNTLKILAEKYPSENLLLVTHWGGVSSMLYKYFKDATKYLVDYCGCVELRRQIMDNDGFGDFEVVTSHGVVLRTTKPRFMGNTIIRVETTTTTIT